MGIFSWLRGETRARVSSAKADDPYVAEMLGARGVFASAAPAEVLSNLAVAARCVALKSEMLASVSLHVFRRGPDGGRERADDQPLYGVLHDAFNANMTAFEGREVMIRDLDLHGNALARIERNARGQVVALWPEPWPNVGVERLESGRLRYRITSRSGQTTVLLAEEILHVRGPSRDGAIGLSPIAIAAGAASLAVGHAETARGLVDNALRPGGLLSFPERLTPDQRERISSQLKGRFQGASNAGRLLMLDGGPKFEPLQLDPVAAEFLASRKLANEDVARIFGIPPTCVGITDKATYSNTEQESTALVRNCLGPLAVRLEQAMMRCLLTPAGRRTYFIEHDLSSLLRGDVQARFEAYRIGREIGALSANDVRRRENEPPISGGDTYHQPANWVSLNAAPAEPGGAG